MPSIFKLTSIKTEIESTFPHQEWDDGLISNNSYYDIGFFATEKDVIEYVKHLPSTFHFKREPEVIWATGPNEGEEFDQDETYEEYGTFTYEYEEIPLLKEYHN